MKINTLALKIKSTIIKCISFRNFDKKSLSKSLDENELANFEFGSLG